ncbi:DMT family transporter [Parabacteroides sp. OttesenSCG-928-G07]|nr:DMT family transporter [Parabacteroides sp. OttesenSCG-928-G07]
MKNKVFLQLHLSILLAGFTGIFGKLITLNEGLLVCYRMLFTVLLLYPILKLRHRLTSVSLSDGIKISGAGLLLGLHWVFFYGSIKAANVSIGVVCFSLIGFFTAILEPILLRRRFSIIELLYSFITVIGILLIFNFDTRYRTGIILGVISTVLCALFTITNKKIGERHSSSTILFYEMIGGFAGLLCLLPLYLHYVPSSSMLPVGMDWLWLLLLSSFCTIGLYLLQIEALRSISAFTLNLSYNLEPVYSILLAMLLFGEAAELNWAFYAGIALIILSVLLQTHKEYVLRKTR